MREVVVGRGGQPRHGAGSRRQLTARVSGFALALSAGIGLSCAASDARSQTLQEAWAKAYYTNPTLEAQRAQLRATDEQVNQALSGWRPTVQASGSIGWNDQTTNLPTVATNGSIYPKNVTLSLQQPVYRGGRTTALTNRAERNVEAQRARLTSTEQLLFLDIGTVYMNALRDQAVLDLNRNNERVIARQLQAARDRFSVGEVTRTDVAQAEARQARAIADRIQSEGNLEVSRTSYERLVGETPGVLVAPALPVILPTSREGAISGALGNNPNVFAASFVAKGAAQNVRAIEGESYPTVNLNGSFSRNYDSTSSGSETESTSLVAQLTVPLYQAGQVASRIREAKETAGQALTQIEEARRTAVQDAAQNWENLVTARARIESLQSQIGAAEIALEGVEQEALVGTRTVLDVLDAEQELLNARVSLVGSQRDLAVAALALASAVGGLTAERLGLPVAYYDPNNHYEFVRNRWWGTDTAPTGTR